METPSRTCPGPSLSASSWSAEVATAPASSPQRSLSCRGGRGTSAIQACWNSHLRAWSKGLLGGGLKKSLGKVWSSRRGRESLSSNGSGSCWSLHAFSFRHPLWSPSWRDLDGSIWPFSERQGSDSYRSCQFNPIQCSYNPCFLHLRDSKGTCLRVSHCLRKRKSLRQQFFQSFLLHLACFSYHLGSKQCSSRFS